MRNFIRNGNHTQEFKAHIITSKPVVSLLDRSLHRWLNFISSVLKHRLIKRGHHSKLVKVGLTDVTLKSLKASATFREGNGSSILK